MTDHGPQRESVRDVLKRHGIDPNRMSENRDDLDILQPYAEDLMPDDHGPQRQPARYYSFEDMLDAMGEQSMAEVVHELARLLAENERPRTLIAAEFVALFTINDGYIFGQDTIDEARTWIKAADALRGSKKQ